jgi:hypothetical protein
MADFYWRFWVICAKKLSLKRSHLDKGTGRARNMIEPIGVQTMVKEYENTYIHRPKGWGDSELQPGTNHASHGNFSFPSWKNVTNLIFTISAGLVR